MYPLCNDKGGIEMKTKYTMISKLKCQNGKLYTVYGIESIEDKKIKIYDITTNKNKLMELIRLCNEKSLSEIHIYDICEDFLTANY